MDNKGLRDKNNSNWAVRLDRFGSDSSRHLEFISSNCVPLPVAKFAWLVSSEGKLMSLFKTDVTASSSSARFLTFLVIISISNLEGW